MVSIVIPVYNVEQYLDTCVESVLKLKTACEIILVDDGSTDMSGKLCDAWAEKCAHITVIHQKNGGLSAARNAGIDWAFADGSLFPTNGRFYRISGRFACALLHNGRIRRQSCCPIWMTACRVC